MIEQGSRLSELKTLRKEFAPTRVGSAAFRMVARGASCEMKIDGEACGNKSKMTAEFDIIGEMEMIPVCGEAHFKMLREMVDKDLDAQGRSTVFGINGFGRGSLKLVKPTVENGLLFDPSRYNI